MNEQTVEKLVEVLREVPPEERDEVVVKAKNQLEEEEKESKRKKEDLEKLFDSQIKKMIDRGCPLEIVNMLREQRDRVLQKVSEITIGKKHIPFLPVISRIYLSIYSQMQMVRNGDKVGYTYLKPSEITDVVETPQDPYYYIFDVEDGEAMLGKSPQNAEKTIKQQNRRGLTEVEVIALAIHTDVRHCVDALGSRCGSERAPGLWLFGDRPRLLWRSLDSASDGWGAASRRSN